MRRQRELNPEYSPFGGVVPKKVKNSKYLDCQISSKNSDAPVLFMNLAKAQKRLAWIFNLITREGVYSAIGGRIYVTAALAVLLYGSETWVWTSSMLNIIYGFHHHACWRLPDKRPKRQQTVHTMSTVLLMKPWESAN